MKILLNATTLIKGGSLQACVSFIIFSIDHNILSHSYYYVLSQELVSQLPKEIFSKLNSYNCTVFNTSPAKSLKARNKLLSIEQSFSPDLVFTFFGPSYCSFKAKHLCGVADGWITHSNKLSFNALSSIQKKILFFLIILYKGFWLRKADAWVVEAACARHGLINRLFIASKNIFIVPNSFANSFNPIALSSTLLSDDIKKKRILCLSAYYPHKNIELIPVVAHVLRNLSPHLDFEFVITIPDSDAGLINISNLSKTLGVESYIHNVGLVSFNDCPALYQSCHISFLPSVLETFTANYPEAMIMGLPILTSDLDFARDICGDAAIYFTPNDAHDAALKILRLLTNTHYYLQQVNLGKLKVKQFPTPEEKYLMYTDIFTKLVS